MPTVDEILARKGTAVITMPTTGTVLEAARLMNERGIGGVLVTDGPHLVGVFTERDVLRRVVAEQRDPASTPLGEVMTTSVISCTRETSLEECSAVMTTQRVRHLPVIDATGVCGIVTAGDLMAYQVADQQATIEYLNGYVFDVR